MLSAAATRRRHLLLERLTCTVHAHGCIVGGDARRVGEYGKRHALNLDGVDRCGIFGLQILCELADALTNGVAGVWCGLVRVAQLAGQFRE